ncbi:fimbria/pilus periplasmic chaperone [Serratia proteamaculans]|uniref:fimbria/pilus periplasmic chaperone n=1 Tax=Serratia proteamaculans TaxID=28151 RepID=UPI0020C6C3DB|nr:fimbria/pilus periplasmic chaperone [Serratia proteamaculans]
MGNNAFASVVIKGTRVIYPSSAREVTIQLENKGQSPVLVQNWIDNGDNEEKPENIKVPFVLTPPINRVDPDKGQTIRISYTGSPLPADKESVFWLNTLEIPAKKKVATSENFMQVAFRTRIKLFYRPAGLQGNPNEAAKSLSWQANGSSLQATNPTPYYVSLVSVQSNGKEVEGKMIPPKGKATFSLPIKRGADINGEFVNDYGAVVKFVSKVN